MSRGYKSWRLPGHGRISKHMILVLRYMIAQDDQYGGAWCDLRQFHQATIYSLMRRDWIQMSKRPDGHVDYKLTLRGRTTCEALVTYQPRQYRRDGMCTTCGEKPRASGSYCLECQRTIKREQYHRRASEIQYRNRGKPCRTCGQNPISMGTMCSKCHCERVKASNRSRAQKMLNGEMPIPTCSRCGERPAVVTAKRIQYYCAPCRRQYDAQARAEQVEYEIARKRVQERNNG